LKRSVLVVAPHHDDECIGCGGLLIKLRLLGWAVHVVVVFDPLEGRDSPAGQKRLAEAKTAARVLQATQAGELEMPCRERVSEEEIIWKLVPVFRSVQPTLLLIPHEEERDPEHRKTHRASVEAAWLSESNFRNQLGSQSPPISAVLGYEVWTPIANPPLTVNISEQLDEKLQALKCYASQLESLDLVNATTGLGLYRGAMSGKGKYCEAFSIIKLDENILSLATL
jgi:N-acetylglucosamine malate deacetylase 1